MSMTYLVGKKSKNFYTFYEKIDNLRI